VTEPRDEAIWRAAIADARAGTLRVLALEGDAGFGKTHALRRIVAELDGFTVRRAFGETESADAAYAILSELTGAIIDPADTNPLSALRLLTRTVDELQHDGPLALVVDDLQWADTESTSVLARFARRSLGDRVLIVTASRPAGAHVEWERMLDALPAQRVQLDGISEDEAGLLIREGGGSAPPELARALVEHTGGNPLHIRALLSEHEPDELLRLARADRLPAPLQLAAQFEARIGAFSPDAARLLAALAVFGDTWTPLRVVARIDGIADAAAAARVLRSEGLVRVRGADLDLRLRIFHSVIRAAVYDTLSAELRTALHRQAAGLALDEGARLRHRSAIALAEPDPALVDDLVAFAGRRHDERHHLEAARSLATAADLSPDAASRHELAVQSWIESLLGGDVESVPPDARRADAADPLQRMVAAMAALGEADFHTAAAAMTSLDPARIAALPDRDRFRIAATAAWSLFRSGMPAARTLEYAIAADGALPDPAFLLWLEIPRTQAHASQQGEQEFWATAGRGLDRTELARTPPGRARLAWRGAVLNMGGFMRESLPDLTLVVSLIGDGSLDFSDGIFHAALVFAHVNTGDLARAAVALEVARTGSSHVVTIAETIAMLFGADADVDGAWRVLGDVRQELLRYPNAMDRMTLELTEVTALLLDGTPEQRRAWQARDLADFGDPGDLDFASPPPLWMAHAGLAADWGADPGDAIRWADRLRALEIAPDWRDTVVRWLRARAASSAGVDTTTELLELARTGVPSVPLLGVELVIDAAERARRHHRPDAEALGKAAARLRREFGRPGAPTALTAPTLDATAPNAVPVPDPADDPFGMLTERERAVAALVVDGMSYAQIAKELYVTRSTVGFHLSNCYAKTGTRTRHELAQLARQGA
jgi:DNA-binding CsgD family transcriptional regulator